jgi:IS30 family transposase
MQFLHEYTNRLTGQHIPKKQAFNKYTNGYIANFRHEINEKYKKSLTVTRQKTLFNQVKQKSCI